MPGPPTSIAGPWRALIDAAGGVTALARAIGTTPRTIQRWASGAIRLSPRSARVVADVARRYRVAWPTESTHARDPHARARAAWDTWTDDDRATERAATSRRPPSNARG